MLVKELKQILNKLDENAEIIITDMDGNNYEDFEPCSHTKQNGYNEDELEIILPYYLDFVGKEVLHKIRNVNLKDIQKENKLNS